MSSKPVDKAILDTVTQGRMRDQRGILDELARQGFDINQSTLSRHLRKLKIRKADGFYRLMSETSSGLGGNQSVQAVVEVGPNLLVIRTLPGHANAISWHLDERKLDEIVGTVAGDDTLFVAVSPPEKLSEIRNSIAHQFNVS